MSSNKKKITESFGLTNLSVNNRTSVIILTLIFVFAGVFSYISMPKENFPEVNIPTVYIGTAYPGNSPVDMENLITRPIEKEVNTVDGIKSIESTSIQDYSTIIVEFNPDVNIERALQDVKDAVDVAKNELPTDLDTEPNVFELDFSEFPIMSINISGDYSMRELKAMAEYLQEEIEEFPQISEVKINGALDREIRIDADIHRMEAMRVSFNDIMDAIRAENLTQSSGDIKIGDFRRSLRIDGEFESIEEIENVIVKDENYNEVYLKDVATVSDTYEERSSYARMEKLPVLTLDVIKKSGENLIEASEQIKAFIEVAQNDELPADLNVSITNDQSNITRNNVSNLENSIISGVILVTLVLTFFLGLRNALFVGVAIPMSMFIAFMLLNLTGVSLNLMVLFSLILALGMLVDNGIVVVENIYRLMQEGYSAKDAAKQGVGEVAWPIITSTATTLAAFVPLAFWQGIIGEFMKYLPITLIIVLSSSLFVALVINPVLTSMYMKVQQRIPNKRRLMIIFGVLVVVAIPLYITQQYLWANLIAFMAFLIPFNVYLLVPAVKWFQEYFLVKLENLYERTLKIALSRPLLVFLGTVGLLFASVLIFYLNAPKVLFFPEGEPNYINIFIEKPVGTDIEATNDLSERIESDIIALMKPYSPAVESIIATVGQNTSDPMEGPSEGDTPNRAKITISFVEFQFRDTINTTTILEEVRREMTKYPGVKITVDKDQQGPPVGKPINIEVSGEDYERLITLTDNIVDEINEANIPGIEELKTDLITGKPEMLVDIDRRKARLFGLSTYSVANELRTALFGMEVSKFKDGEDEYPINLRLKDEYRYDPEALKNKRVTFRDMFGNLKQIPISSVADFKYSSTYGSVKRKDLDRVITIFSNVNAGYNPTEINNRIKEILNDYPMPQGYNAKFTGEQEEQAKSLQFLITALLVAVAVIFLIIVAQFNSVFTPFIIVGSVILSTIGVFLGLVIFNKDFVVVMTGIGIISLAGVVVNNAIVLIDYTNLIRKRRREELNLDEDELLNRQDLLNSIIAGGKTRLRPVLLTAITTILGLIPLAIGMNIDFYGLVSKFDANIYFGGDNAGFWGPMAWTVIYGLTFATFLTLVVVPVMYLLSDILKERLQKLSKLVQSA